MLSRYVHVNTVGDSQCVVKYFEKEKPFFYDDGTITQREQHATSRHVYGCRAT